MHVTLDSLARACREVLASDNTPQGRERILALVREAIHDAAFIEAQFNGATGERRILYEDPELGFCILAHEYTSAKDSGPHDHGPSWAIYGQAAGETMMRDFTLVEPATRDAPGKVREARSYRLGPGDVHLYNEGDLHAPSRRGPTRLVRIEGMNMDKVQRLKYQVLGQ